MSGHLGSFVNCWCLFCLKQYLLPKWMNEWMCANPYVKCLAHGWLPVGVTVLSAIIMIRMCCVQWEEPIQKVYSQLRQAAIFVLSTGISSTVLSLGKTTGSLSIVRSHEINCKNKREFLSVLRKKGKQQQEGREDWEKEKTASFAKCSVTWGHRLQGCDWAQPAPNLEGMQNQLPWSGDTKRMHW